MATAIGSWKQSMTAAASPSSFAAGAKPSRPSRNANPVWFWTRDADSDLAMLIVASFCLIQRRRLIFVSLEQMLNAAVSSP
jgi:hypothetical protein